MSRAVVLLCLECNCHTTPGIQFALNLVLTTSASQDAIMPIENTSTSEATEDSADTNSAGSDLHTSPFAIVGIGASAGGLEAICDLLRNLPEDTGMAYVFVSHLDPAHESALTEILSKVSQLPASEVVGDETVEPNHVYVIPPNSDIVVEAGKLQLLPRSTSREPHMPIDRFLRSLALERESRSVAVILSGTGTDGMLGVIAVKGAGGITFAQDETATHSGMPRSAVASNCVDAVLPAAAIAQELARLGSHPYLNHFDAETSKETEENEDDVEAVLHLLSQSSGVDFKHYKRPTLIRRIQRRIVLRRLQTIGEYLHYLRTHTEELRLLYEEVLIQVTRFFRDSESFDVLKGRVLPELTNDRQTESPIRIWVAGCATGEEAYSHERRLCHHHARSDSHHHSATGTALLCAVL